MLIDLSSCREMPPVKFDLAIIEAMMLWPDDEKMREKALQAARMELRRSALKAGKPEDPMQRVALAFTLAELGGEMPRPAEIRPFVKGQRRGLARGLATGDGGSVASFARRLLETESIDRHHRPR